MAKAAVLLPRQEMQQMAADLIAQYPNLSPFCIEYTHTDAACQRAIRLQNDGCELILARGLQAALVDELAHQMPNIVGMKDTSGDITLTLARQPEAVAIDFHTVSGQLRSDVTNSPDAPAVWKLETVSGNADIFLMQ